jgi:hypothetical protein
MENWKEIVRKKYRFETERGILTPEQLWDLPIMELDKLAVSHEQAYKESGKKSFLVTKSKKDKELKLKFDIILDILTTKVEEQEERKLEADKKTHEQKILGLIKEKKDNELKNLSIQELEKMLK